MSSEAGPPGLRRALNHLAGQRSPYLLQHQGNPVDWHPWNADSLALAKRLDRPIFLSIGYSTCHWCHVMERECFNSQEIAEQLNGGFVSIMVDREERPDLDRQFMAFVQAITGHGGWPLTVFLTPSLTRTPCSMGCATSNIVSVLRRDLLSAHGQWRDARAPPPPHSHLQKVHKCIDCLNGTNSHVVVKMDGE